MAVSFGEVVIGVAKTQVLEHIAAKPGMLFGLTLDVNVNGCKCVWSHLEY